MQQCVFDVGFQLTVLAEQVVQITVQKSVLPHQLKQGVHEKPSVFHIVHARRCVEQFIQRRLVAVEQRCDQLLFGRVVVVQVAGADVELGRDQCGRHIGLAKAVEEVKRDLQNSLCGTTWRFLCHGA